MGRADGPYFILTKVIFCAFKARDSALVRIRICERKDLKSHHAAECCMPRNRGWTLLSVVMMV